MDGVLPGHPVFRPITHNRRDSVFVTREFFVFLDGVLKILVDPIHRVLVIGEQQDLPVPAERRRLILVRHLPCTGILSGILNDVVKRVTERVEEDWSQWLAHLIRSSSGGFTRHLFGERYNDSPNQVRREVRVHNNVNQLRRLDIVIKWPNRGISIEVKIDDTEFGDKPNAAYLIEENHDPRHLDWNHLLLLPESNRKKLSQDTDIRIEDSERNELTVVGEAENEVDMTVNFWKEVSMALRLTLFNLEELNSHWSASAYVFCSIIEQRIMRFLTYPIVKRMADDDALRIDGEMLSRPANLLREQSQYLQNFKVRSSE